MTFEGHIDRAPCLLPHRERDKALVIPEAMPRPPDPAGTNLIATPADEARCAGSEPFRLPAPGTTTSEGACDGPAGVGMKTITRRLGPAQWDTWYREGRAVDRSVTDAEADRFLRHVSLSAGSSVLDVGCGLGSFSRQFFRWGHNVLELEISPAAVEIAQRRGTQERLRYGVHDFDASAVPTTLQSGSFDLNVCRNVLPFLDHQRFMVDARRRLRPGGQLYVLVRVWSERGGEPDDKPWQRGFTEEEVQDLQNGWAEQERCWLGRHTALFVSDERRRTD